MRYKPVPPPRSIEDLAVIQAAVPLVPGSTDDCCARIVARTPVSSRDRARAWLTFLQALELVAERSGGYVRTDRDPESAGLGELFLANVYGVREVAAVLAGGDGPLSGEVVVERVSVMPRWERDRSLAADQEWGDRIADILEWGVVFGVFGRTERGYTLSDAVEDEVVSQDEFS